MRGISNIIGAIIMLQIVIISLLLILNTMNNQSAIELKVFQRINDELEKAPLTEYVTESGTYLYSPTSATISYIIYPNGEMKQVKMTFDKISVSNILNGCTWAIIVTSDGRWYNVTQLPNLGFHFGSNIITFPSYTNYGLPLNSDGVYVYPEADWNYIKGIEQPDYAALKFVNVTVGNSKYEYGLTNSILYFYSKSQWINITFFEPLDTHIYKNSPNYWCVAGHCAELGLYIPVNASNTTFSTIEYIYIDPTIVWSDYMFASWDPYSYWWNGPYGGIVLDSFCWYPAVYPAYPLTINITGSNVSTVPYRAFYGLREYFGYANFTVYQLDMNLNKGEFLLWASPLGDIQLNSSEEFGWTIPAWNVPIYFPVYGQSYNASLNSITINDWYLILNFTIPPNMNFTVLSSYPIYLAIPQGVYILQVST